VDTRQRLAAFKLPGSVYTVDAADTDWRDAERRGRHRRALRSRSIPSYVPFFAATRDETAHSPRAASKTEDPNNVRGDSQVPWVAIVDDLVGVR
jgi:hypothetical protein